ncbi:MAG: acetoacetate decarboxylase family protein, partial [Mycetocola sp.]
SREEYATRPMPHWGPPYDPTIAKYRNIDYISIAFATDAENAAALIPEELELVDIPALPGHSAVNLVFAKYRECDLGPYTEVIVSIPVRHKGQVYGYVPAIYVDNDAALLAGRELGGYPKKMADITIRNYGNLFLSQMSRGSMQEKTADPSFSDVASCSVTKGERLFSVPLPAATAVELPTPYDQLLPLPPPSGQPQDYVIPTMALRRFPGIGAGPDGAAGAEVLQLVATPWHITKAEFFAGDLPSMELYPSKDDPIAQMLPCNLVLGAFILRGDMYTKSEEWMLLENLNEAAAT